MPAQASPQAVATIERMVNYRHQASQLTFFPRVTANSPIAGLHKSRHRGRGMDFDEVRPYQPGDDIRTIDWRVTARTTLTHTKLFREERERPVLLICDLRDTMFFGSNRLKSVVACEAAAALAWAALAANERVGGMIFTATEQQDIRSKRSHHVVLRYIHALHEASLSLFQRKTSSITLEEITRDMRRVVLPGTSAFLISDFHDLDARSEANLSRLSRHSDLTLVQVYDNLEAQLPPPGHYRIFDGNRYLSLNTGNREQRRRFEQQFHLRQSRLKEVVDRLKTPLLELRTSTEVMPVLQQAYGRKPRSRRR